MNTEAPSANIQPKLKKLTVKEEAFVQLLFARKTQADAYREVYKCDNWKPNSIYCQASKLANSPKIVQRLSELQAQYQERNFVSIERLELEYARLAFFDPRKLFNSDGTPKDITELDDDTAAAIAGLDVEDLYEYDPEAEARVKVGVVKKYKIADKLKALQDLGKYKGMFQEKASIMNVVFQIQPPPPPELAYLDEDDESP